jgi:hypothetical protein
MPYNIRPAVLALELLTLIDGDTVLAIVAPTLLVRL